MDKVVPLSPSLMAEMDKRAKDLPTKSAKIRVLAKAGYSRSEIAKYLGVRYQHVRNVLVQDPAKHVATQDDLEAMDGLTATLDSKADKIRALGKAGYSRADIARYLGVRYQHVRNVLVRAEATSQQDSTADLERDRAIWTRLGRDGRLEIPDKFREALGLKEGDDLQLWLAQDEVRVVPRDVAYRRMHEMVAMYVPSSVSLVDELIEERSREAALEDQGA